MPTFEMKSGATKLRQTRASAISLQLVASLLEVNALQEAFAGPQKQATRQRTRCHPFALSRAKWDTFARTGGRAANQCLSRDAVAL